MIVKQGYQTGHFYRTKIDGKCHNSKNSNTTFWVIFKHYVNVFGTKNPDFILVWQWDIFRWFSNTVLGVKKSPIWVSRDGPKHEGGPLKNLKGKALTEVPTIVFDCAYVGSSVEAPSPRWWGAKWHQRWHMTSLKLEFNIYRGSKPPNLKLDFRKHCFLYHFRVTWKSWLPLQNQV